ncbi:sensor histidine kinase [Methylosinus sp. H3A]|uniref:sensor histidine kinase n=1 Tax=Methylosinus sp. H3A TaxID=2785786 RepID=UPI001FEFE055|nr:HAMP domain-containing sensor histidine kinase [Methylosinus sp. H3A]
MRGPSLVARTVAFLVVAQIVAFSVAWFMTLGLGLAGIERFTYSLDELSTARAQKQVVASLARDEDGQIVIAPTPALRHELAHSPTMKVAAFDTLRGRPLGGSAPELVEALRPLITMRPTHVHFVLPGQLPSVRLGLLEPQWTRFGPVHVAVYETRFHLSDILDDAVEASLGLAAYILMAILMSGVAAWIAVRWGLRPLREIVAEAARIDMDSLHQRLSLKGVSAEIGPLVEAVNGALARLDAGVARQRRFTANAAHELRTPVTILGARLDAPEEPSFKNDLRRDHRRIRNIVEQLLAAARLGGNTARFEEGLDLAALARAMIGDAALLAVRSRRHLILEAPQTPVLVTGNRVALESVIANLIDNALRAEPEGGTVLVRIFEDASLWVEDHGDGVDENDQAAIFEPFWRKSDAAPGTGLGLAIAKELIDAHGGRIWVETTPGGGATFKISFDPRVGRRERNS